MWLLKLHFSFSVLCLLTYVGFRSVLKETIKENGYTPTGKRPSYWIFFIPILNIASVVLYFVMAGVKHDDLIKWCEEHKSSKKNNSKED